MRKMRQEEDEKLPALVNLLSDFDALDHKIGVEKTKKQLIGRTLEQESYNQMDRIVNQIARKQSMGYYLSKEEQKQLLDKHIEGYKPGGDLEIKTASDFINQTSEVQDYYQYLWTARGW